MAICAGMAFCLFVAGRAEALAVVFEQLPADPFTAGTFFSDADQPREAATGFSLTSSASIASIVWWGGYSGSSPIGESSDFVIRFYAEDAGGGPALAAFYEAAVSTRVTDIGGIVPSFRFAAALPVALDLPGGAPLWLAIVDVDSTRPTFGWRKTTEAETSYSRPAPGFGWAEAPGLASFRLEATAIPEPGTALLALLGFSLLGIGHRPLAGRRESVSGASRRNPTPDA